MSNRKKRSISDESISDAAGGVYNKTTDEVERLQYDEAWQQALADSLYNQSEIDKENGNMANQNRDIKAAVGRSLQADNNGLKTYEGYHGNSSMSTNIY